ncbi:cell division protein ZapA [Frigidibacter sp. MR17.24]|uniref:cell division protein ZapA n=1 Tax=Frigidibacter sp. MR17.24 TaxID=3127345 RepID=UPI003012C037
MPEIRISIGNRDFDVACQQGEEHFLRAAAAMLDAEAQPLLAQLGRIPETRMLLMAGLLLADRTAALEDQLREAEGRAREAGAEVARLKADPVTREVPVIPAAVTETLAEIAARTEALAARIEDGVAG